MRLYAAVTAPLVPLNSARVVGGVAPSGCGAQFFYKPDATIGRFTKRGSEREQNAFLQGMRRCSGGCCSDDDARHAASVFGDGSDIGDNLPATDAIVHAHLRQASGRAGLQELHARLRLRFESLQEDRHLDEQERDHHHSPQAVMVDFIPSW
jgi:hypothetical protein